MNDIARQRLRHQGLIQSGEWVSTMSQPTDVVSYFAAMQAQEFAMAKWAIGLRLPTITEADISDAFDSGQILRTHLLRPTWHFVTPTDIGWLLMLTAPRVKQISAFMDRQCGLDEALFTQTNDLIGTALANHTYLTRDELAAVLDQANIRASGPRLGQIMMRAELDGIIASGPRRGNQFTYALLDERAPNRTVLSRDEALAELTKRYITSRGPATAYDFSVWSGLTLQEVRAGIAMLTTIELKIVDDQTYYATIDEPPSVEMDDNESTFLLPDYDEYGMGYKDRAAIIDATFTGTPTYNRMVVVDGLIVGSWRRTPTGSRVLLDIQLSRPLTDKQQKSLAKAAERYGQFIGRDVDYQALS